MSKSFHGVCAVAVTPFCADGGFDYAAAKANLDYLYGGGIRSVCVMGATGEYLSVSNEEHKAYISQIVPYIKDRMTVIVGASRERSEDAVDLIRNAKDAGAHAAMVLPPYYCHPEQEEIVAHYQHIAAQADFPLMVYNNPGSAGVCIGRDSFREIFKIKQVRLVKESTGDIRKLTEVRLDAPPEVSVFCGCDNLAYESFLAGADGWVSMLANVAPKDCAALYHSVCEEGDPIRGSEIYRRLLPALNFLESFPKPVQALKYVLGRKGLRGGFVRRPRQELTEAEKQQVWAGMRPEIFE